MMTLLKDLHGAPPESFVVQLSLIIGDFKSLQKMALLWRSIIIEVINQLLLVMEQDGFLLQFYNIQELKNLSMSSYVFIINPFKYPINFVLKYSSFFFIDIHHYGFTSVLNYDSHTYKTSNFDISFCNNLGKIS